MAPPFANRADAGRLLGQRLAGEGLPAPVVVVALPRGGVPVGAEVARQLHAPLELLLVRKIGAPWQPELAVGAVADGDAPEIVVDDETAAACGVDRAYIEREATSQWSEIMRRRQAYLRGRAPLPLAGATVVLVDDGIATGTTVRAALLVLRRRAAQLVVLAVPVAAPQALAMLGPLCDRIVCLAQPRPFRAVGLHYQDFHQVSDAEVLAALPEVRRRTSAPPVPPPTGPSNGPCKS